MAKLTIVSLNRLLLAYIVSPLIGLALLWLMIISHDLFYRDFSPVRELLLIPWILVFGGIFGIFIEVIFVTPLIIGFQHIRKNVINIWEIAVLGFMIGFIIWMSVCGAEIFGYNATRTTWSEGAMQSAACGTCSMVAALVFRIIGFR